MSDRVPAAALETHRGTIERAGRTDRPTIAFPVAIHEGADPIDLVLDGRTYYATVRATPDGGSSIRAAYDSPATARTGPAGAAGAVNRLATWIDATDLAYGRTVLLDIVDPGRVYGLRAPGESTVYSIHDRDDGLASIAASIEDRDDVT